MEMRGKLIRGILALGAAGLATACRTTTVEFRNPRDSHLDLEGTWGNPTRRVYFPSLSRVTFRQFASQDSDKGARLSGEIRIDREIDLERIPPGSERYLIRDGDAVRIPVKGYYWIYKYEATVEDELTVHYVDILPEQIYALLEGRPITVPSLNRSRSLIYRFQLGIELPARATRP